MEIALAIKYGITARELAGSFHAYLTLSEGVKLAALSFGKDVAKLSCCAQRLRNRRTSRRSTGQSSTTSGAPSGASEPEPWISKISRTTCS